MNESIAISCDITPTCPENPVGLTISVNDQIILDLEQVTESIKFNHLVELPENQEHVLKLTLKNKRPEHTKMDDSGHITQDSNIVIEHVAFDELELGQILVERAIYEHDFNGSGVKTQDQFFKEMGCNGTVSLKFNTPVYLWLLENI